MIKEKKKKEEGREVAEKFTSKRFEDNEINERTKIILEELHHATDY